MTTALDVLLIEARPGAGADDADRLAAGGHHVHRCWGPGTAVDRSGPGFAPCLGLTDDACPLDEGIDVALLVRPEVAPRTSEGESGVRCVLRAGIPLVEHGGDLLDPFAPWLAGRVGDDVVAGCEAAAHGALAPVADAARGRMASILVAQGIDPAAVEVRFEADGDSLEVHVVGPPVDHRTRRALCVRALGAVRGTPRPFTRVGVGYQEA